MVTRKTEAVRRHSERENEAYADFLKSIAGIVLAQKHQDTKKEEENTVLLGDK